MAARPSTIAIDSARTLIRPRDAVLFTLACWATATIVALWLRPLMPIDETRYLTVAWEMWWRNEFLVPLLNGEPYHGKPPLLFWLIHLVWWVTGVDETAARIIPAAFTAASLALTVKLARMLWPGQEETAGLSAVVLIAMPIIMLFGTLVMFDMPLTFFVLLGMIAVVGAARDGTARWWWLFGFAIGAGILTKGPVALLHLLPAPLLAPLWLDAGGRPAWRRWYARLGLALLGGLALCLAWAVPAAIAGGPEYRNAVLWSETAGRITKAFAHARPWWFYLATLPAVLYPWAWTPAFWRGLRSGRWREPGARFCLAWCLPSFIVLTMISGKQVHYLLPLLPCFALLASRSVSGAPFAPRALDLILPSVVPVVFGLALMLLSISPLTFMPVFPRRQIPSWVVETPVYWGSLLIAGAVVLSLATGWWARTYVMGTAAAALLLYVVVHAAGNAAAIHNYELASASRFLAAHRGVDIAYNNTYEGEFGFLGRLKRRVALVYNNQIPRWAARHHGALVVLRYKEAPKFIAGAPAFEQQYRGQRLGIWIVP